MKYELLSIEESRSAHDYYLALRRKPNFWERLMGKRDDRLVFYGHDDDWQTVRGTPVRQRMQQIVSRFWTEHRPDDESALMTRARPEDPGALTNEMIDEELDESFPASDPPSWTSSAL